MKTKSVQTGKLAGEPTPNLRARDQFIVAARKYHTHPITLFFYIFPLVALALGLFKPEFAHLGLSEWSSNLITAAKVVGFWAVTYAILGPVAHWAMTRGWPFVAVPIGLWVTGVVLSQAITAILVDLQGWDLLRVIRQSVLAMPGLIASVYLNETQLRQDLGLDPALVPIWRPVRRQDLVIAPKPFNLSGRIRRIHAANQYVLVVTTEGEAKLRLGLTEAAAMMPRAKGWRCHRSLWISREEVRKLVYVNGQPHVVDHEGQTYPISRGAVPEIRMFLQEKGYLHG